MNKRWPMEWFLLSRYGYDRTLVILEEIDNREETKASPRR